MQRLEVEDQIQLAYVLEKTIEGLDEDLDEIKKRKGRFGGCRYDDEVESRVVAVGDEGRCVVVGRRGCAGFGAAGKERREARYMLARILRQTMEERTVRSYMLSLGGWRRG